LNIDKDISEFKIQEDEVEEVKWFKPGELKTAWQKNPEEFLPRMDKYQELFV
jgi:isopentenyldiphosphate isomerase